MFSAILNLPRKLLAHSLNLLIAIPLTFIGLLARALAEWLFKDNNQKPIVKKEVSDEEFEEALAYLKAELDKQEAAIDRLEDEDEMLWDIEVELETMEELGEDDDEKTIH